MADETLARELQKYGEGTTNTVLKLINNIHADFKTSLEEKMKMMQDDIKKTIREEFKKYNEDAVQKDIKRIARKELHESFAAIAAKLRPEPDISTRTRTRSTT